MTLHLNWILIPITSESTFFLMPPCHSHLVEQPHLIEMRCQKLITTRKRYDSTVLLSEHLDILFAFPRLCKGTIKIHLSELSCLMHLQHRLLQSLAALDRGRRLSPLTQSSGFVPCSLFSVPSWCSDPLWYLPTVFSPAAVLLHSHFQVICCSVSNHTVSIQLTLEVSTLL